MANQFRGMAATCSNLSFGLCVYFVFGNYKTAPAAPIRSCSKPSLDSSDDFLQVVESIQDEVVLSWGVKDEFGKLENCFHN